MLESVAKINSTPVYWTFESKLNNKYFTNVGKLAYKDISKYLHEGEVMNRVSDAQLQVRENTLKVGLQRFIFANLMKLCVAVAGHNFIYTIFHQCKNQKLDPK